MFERLRQLTPLASVKFWAISVCALLLSHSATAQFAASPCDPGYYESLEARAWLEAQREITQNQNLIFKPDSVLEYTCFDNHLRELADHANVMFSETTRWGTAVLTAPVAQDEHMDNALNLLVSSALATYDTANFGSFLLGGRVFAWAPATAPSEATGTGYVPEATISTTDTDYACDIMQAVWVKAKCLNFIDSAANDGFFTFEHYADPANTDKRFLPTTCTGAVDWAGNIETAFPPIGAATPPWEFDDTVTYLDSLFPITDCGTGLNRVVTGLVVENANASGIRPRFYEENVCLVPGCHWVPNDNAGTTITSPEAGGNCTRAY